MKYMYFLKRTLARFIPNIFLALHPSIHASVISPVYSRSGLQKMLEPVPVQISSEAGILDSPPIHHRAHSPHTHTKRQFRLSNEAYLHGFGLWETGNL